MAAHSSILAGRIPWTEEPGELQSTGCKESDTTERQTHTHISDAKKKKILNVLCLLKKVNFKRLYIGSFYLYNVQKQNETKIYKMVFKGQDCGWRRRGQ